MNRFFKWFVLGSFLLILSVGISARGAGTWVPLANFAPGAAGHLLLLSDGTVLAENLSTNNGPGWFRLTPDIHGSYVNGTWSSIAVMHDTRLDFASDVLRDGRVLVAGGEYGSGFATSEVYDPVSNTWTAIPVPTSLINPTVASPEVGENQGFSDAISVVVANGKVLIAPVGGNVLGATMLFDPVLNTWSAGPQTFEKGYPDQAESSWVKLPDNSILTVDGGATTAERYIPASNTWISDASAPVLLYDTFGEEEGPALLLPNGKAIFFGGSGHTCIYTPSGNTNPGSWVAGPDFPNGQAMPDAPAVMMVNGKILCATSAAPTSGNHFPTPTSFYEYDYLSNTFTAVSAPGGGASFGGAPYPTLMLDLPDGTVLFTHRSTDLYIYKPDGVPLAAGRPTISSMSTNADGSLHFIGTGFNGLSQGSAYGDDEQMDSNFPIVRFIDGVGNVRYGRTFNWSSTGVATGAAVVSTDCTIPVGASTLDTIQLIANGISSTVIAPTVLITNDNGAGSLRQLAGYFPAGTTITFSPSLSGKTISLTNGEIALAKNLIIDASALPAGIAINGNHHSRIFNGAFGVTATLNALTLTNGYAGSGNWGGAIISSGFLTLSNCTLVGNAVDGTVDGGAIANSGTMNLFGCTLTGNSAGYGGAIENTYVCSLRNCTVAENLSQKNGGGIDNNKGTLALSQCTLSSNVVNVGVGGAMDNYQGTTTVTNSILAENTSSLGNDIYNWASSTMTVAGTNIVTDLVNAGTLNSPGTVLTVNPLLAPLGKYGGFTAVLPPLPGSPAIDGGSDAAGASLTTDQRGYPRLSGSHVDIGAVEVQIASVLPVLRSSNSPGGAFQFSFTNLIGGSFTVLASTNAALPLNQWSNIGVAIESPVGSGQFQFVDSQAAGQMQRYYVVRSP